MFFCTRGFNFVSHLKDEWEASHQERFNRVVLGAGFDTLETRVTETEWGEQTFIQGWSDRAL